MKKLMLVSIAVFVVGTLVAVLAIGDGNGTIIDSFSFLKKDGMHYFFTIRTGKIRQTVEVAETVYNSHGYGDMFDFSWVKVDGYRPIDVKPMGNDQDSEPH
jgi:hypothetical protein